MRDENWDRILLIDLKGIWVGMRAVLSTMVERGSGSIVNIASAAGLFGQPGLRDYSASKGGIIRLLRRVTIEYVKQGITVNVIAQGLIRTQISARRDKAVLDAMEAATPSGRFGAPKDIAASIAHLVSKDASFVTGQVLAIDGGWSAA
jgi:NAD(P)-dependent dehydrogenase (short-subunit alcohol dehydrogenase family)